MIFSIIILVCYDVTGISLVDETPEATNSSTAPRQDRPLVEGVAFAYDAPDKDKAEKEEVRARLYNLYS